VPGYYQSSLSGLPTPGGSAGCLLSLCIGNAIRKPTRLSRGGAAPGEFVAAARGYSMGRIPWIGMAGTALPGCFDSSSVAMRSLELAQHDKSLRVSLFAAINGALLPKATHTSTPGVSPGVFFILCRRGAITEARQGFRATGLRKSAQLLAVSGQPAIGNWQLAGETRTSPLIDTDDTDLKTPPRGPGLCHTLCVPWAKCEWFLRMALSRCTNSQLILGQKCPTL
jgi:hypothetical protein